jgi:hypothetical protein
MNSARASSEFVQEILEWQTTCGVNVFLTSRSIPETANKLTQFPSMEVRASSKDVQRYIEANLGSLRPCIRNNMQLREEIKATVIEAADGLYGTPTVIP